MIDYKEIIDNLQLSDVKNLLTHLNIPFKETDTALIMPTVCHNENIEEASWKLYYYKNTHIFYCYTECESQSIFKFLRHFYEARHIVYDWYTDIFQVVTSCTPMQDLTQPKRHNEYISHKADYMPQKIRKELPAYSEGVLEVFQHKYPIEWINDNISKQAMDKFNICYSISQNKIIIPHYDIHDRLVGIRGRALNPEEIENFGKYAPVQIEGTWYSHPLSLNLYGLNSNYKNIRKYRKVFLFEAEKSVLQCESFNLPHCAVASCGSNLNKFQIDLLIRYCAPQEIIVCYDNEEIKGNSRYFDRLFQLCSRYKQYCNMSFIYDIEHLTHLKDSPSDNGEDIFIHLLKKRVKIH